MVGLLSVAYLTGTWARRSWRNDLTLWRGLRYVTVLYRSNAGWALLTLLPRFWLIFAGMLLFRRLSPHSVKPVVGLARACEGTGPSLYLFVPLFKPVSPGR